jgi:hypothetical protein
MTWLRGSHWYAAIQDEIAPIDGILHSPDKLTLLFAFSISRHLRSPIEFTVFTGAPLPGT